MPQATVVTYSRARVASWARARLTAANLFAGSTAGSIASTRSAARVTVSAGVRSIQAWISVNSASSIGATAGRSRAALDHDALIQLAEHLVVADLVHDHRPGDPVLAQLAVDLTQAAQRGMRIGDLVAVGVGVRGDRFL